MKKCVFILAIALLSVAAYGRDFVSTAGTTVNPPASTNPYNDKASEIKYENYEWPVDSGEWFIPYKPQAMCKFDVKMDVGFWVQIDNCKDLVMNLKQMSIHKYTGCTQLLVSNNVDIELGASFAKTNSSLVINADPAFAWAPGKVLAPGKGQKVNLTMTLDKVDLSGMEGGKNCVKIGEITITVKPLVKFNYSFGDKCQPDTENCPPLQ